MDLTANTENRASIEADIFQHVAGLMPDGLEFTREEYFETHREMDPSRLDRRSRFLGRDIDLADPTIISDLTGAYKASDEYRGSCPWPRTDADHADERRAYLADSPLKVWQRAETARRMARISWIDQTPAA